MNLMSEFVSEVVRQSLNKSIS